MKEGRTCIYQPRVKRPWHRKSCILLSDQLRGLREKCFSSYSSFVTAVCFLEVNSEFLAVARICEIITVTLC